jgi:hypothetical protein
MFSIVEGKKLDWVGLDVEPQVAPWIALWCNNNRPSWQQKLPSQVLAGFGVPLVCNLRQVTFPLLTKKYPTGFSRVL